MRTKVQLDQNSYRSSASQRPGLLLGTTTHHLRILYLVPTPTTPRGTSQHRWAVEHANLIRPMCPGGLTILGTYLPLQGTSASPANDVDSAAAIARDVTAQSQHCHTALVLCRGPKGRAVVKQAAANQSDQLRTVDLKEMPNLTNNVISIRATLSIPPALFPIIYNFNTPAEFKSACYSIGDNLMSGFVLQLPDELHTVVTNADDTRNLAETMRWQTATTKAKKKSSFSHNPIDAQLLAPVCFDCDYHTSSVDQMESEVNFTSLLGSVHLEAVTTFDATNGDVFNALQVDFVRSWRTRVDLLMESYLPDDDDGSHSEAQWDHPKVSAFPARVVASPVSGTSHFPTLTEYLMPAETIDDDFTVRFTEAFSWDEEKLKEFKIELKERHNSEQNESGERFCPVTPQTEEPSIAADSANSAIDISSIMQTSLLATFVVGFLAILIKEILNFL